MEQSDRVVVLNLGTTLAEGLPDDIQRNQAVRDAYLGERDPQSAEMP
jgi:branched-chain amino acid transport system ATP-binding protein